jgi:phytoene synthase
MEREHDAATLLARHGQTFHFAARFLPPDKRQAVVTLYALCRTLDDLVDEPMPGWTAEMVHDELAAWRRWVRTHGLGPAPREPLGTRAALVLQTHRIPTEYLLALLDGLQSDLTPRQIATFAELEHYCYQVASTVGLMMAHVLGSTSAQALEAAVDLGRAMQLTNILRDVGADLQRGRLYLPAGELAAHASSAAHLRALQTSGQGADERFSATMRFQMARAHAYYERGLAGIWLLPADCRLPIMVAGQLYRRILTVIERQDYDVLRRRASTSRTEKVLVAMRASMEHYRGDRRGSRVATGGPVERTYRSWPPRRSHEGG